MAVVQIDLTECINCSWCRRVCPSETIKYFATGHRTHVVEPNGCIDCGICVQVCPVDCIHPAEYDVPPDLLESAKAKARAFAGNQRRMKLNRQDVVDRTLARLAERTAAHA